MTRTMGQDQERWGRLVGMIGWLVGSGLSSGGGSGEHGC